MPADDPEILAWRAIIARARDGFAGAAVTRFIEHDGDEAGQVPAFLRDASAHDAQMCFWSIGVYLVNVGKDAHVGHRLDAAQPTLNPERQKLQYHHDHWQPEDLAPEPVLILP
jgi:hypothetical protein